MITNLICLYIDFQDVSSEVRSIVNVDRYGDLLYKKKKLKDHHRQLYSLTKVGDFQHVTNYDQLEHIAEALRHVAASYVIFHHSSFAVSNSKEFFLFMEKIMYLDLSFSISDYDEQKPFVVLKAPRALQLIENICKKTKSIEYILENDAEIDDSFKLEKFYKTIGTSVKLIEFLHTNFEARYFNSIQKDELYITKSSENKTKIENEYLYYDFLPDELKLFFLRPFQLEKGANAYSYKIEKLNVPDVSILWLHNSFNTKEFIIFIEKAFLFLKKRPTKVLQEKDYSSAIESFYIKKVKDRIADLKSKPEYATISEIIKNSTSIGNIDALFDAYKAKLDAILVTKRYQPRLALSHGDLCASNMLYDKRIDLLKLIDPRGAETQEGLYLDSYYDVCKLSHSIMGDYDLINNGLFELAYTQDLQIQLKIDQLPNNDMFKKFFVKALEQNQFDYELVRIFEVSLFISMLALHIDNPKKVLAFILNAIRILNEIDA